MIDPEDAVALMGRAADADGAILALMASMCEDPDAALERLDAIEDAADLIERRRTPDDGGRLHELAELTAAKRQAPHVRKRVPRLRALIHRYAAGEYRWI